MQGRGGGRDAGEGWGRLGGSEGGPLKRVTSFS